MSAIHGASSASTYRSSSSQSTQRAQRNRPDDPTQLIATIEQDLSQSGLKSGVSPTDLVANIQSSIKSAIHDPANRGKDVVQVVQDAVKSTLKANGVDTDKLESLLKSQFGDAPAPGAANAFGPNGPHGTHRHGHPPGTLPASTTTSTSPTDPASIDSLRSKVLDSDGDHDGKGTQSTSSKVATSNGNAPGSTNNRTATHERLKSSFERQLASIIRSLPSGSAIDVKA